jgi:hypothetical protein
MTGATFITHVQVKLNRLDTAAYEDVRPEEVIFFANDALKSLTLGFDLGYYSQLVDRQLLDVYLAGLHKVQPELVVTGNEVALPVTVLKVKGLEAFVVKGTESGWVDTRRQTNEEVPNRESNPFLNSFPDMPNWRLIGGKIKFDAVGFNCTKVRYDYLATPTVITEGSTLTYPFMPELEDKTVILILENLEARRVQTQPAVTKS